MGYNSYYEAMVEAKKRFEETNTTQYIDWDEDFGYIVHSDYYDARTYGACGWYSGEGEHTPILPFEPEGSRNVL